MVRAAMTKDLRLTGVSVACAGGLFWRRGAKWGVIGGLR